MFGATTCPDVTGLTASNVTDNSVTLNWDTNPLARTWIIEYGFHGFDQGTGTTVSSSTNSYVATDLVNDMEYDFRVHTVCDTGWQSEGWATVTVTTQPYVIVCEPPTDVNTVVSGNTATVSWAAGEGNLSFEIEYGRPGFSPGSNPILPVTAPPVTITNLDYATEYDLYVRAVCEQNTYSDWSDVANFITASVGINSVTEPSCTIYPNPYWRSRPNGSNPPIATITVSGISGKVRIVIVDINGRELTTETLECANNCTKSLDIDRLAQGTYFVRITGENANLVRKLIVR